MDVADFQAASPIELDIAALKRAVEMSPSPPAKKPNLSWKRRKDELLKLRSESEALQTRLMFLKLRKTHAMLLRAGVGLSDEQRHWKNAAESEKRKYQSSKDENTQLKDQLHRCFKACRDLHTVVSVAGVKQRDLVVANPFAARVLRAELRNGHLLQPSSAVLINLETRLNARHSELEYLFHHARESILGPDGDQVTVLREGVDGTSPAVEFRRNQSMPFDATQAFRAIWKVMHMGVIPEDQTVSVIQRTKDTLVSQGHDMRELPDGGSVNVRVTAWTHMTHDSGWALVHPNVLRPGTCQFQLSLRLRTHAAPSEQNGPTLLTPVVSNVVIPSFREMLRARHQLVENALLDASMGGSVQVEQR
ncbi:hypothetical protein PHYSODRAFT_524171 [Phytophthora sojae]|uniref:Uncharacterized protein n=1 Tax=Phytophthora sojae (strain P6497) TaxID=1094619 RepID=G5A6H1_PHYSP|nr:hypothetical protein PHYSODRAFT_524171 [Phytophthora sojae]EGZ08926.1 hypothetical protein PHYSODRAFT_524171 [Phytophthora sojae]|eukprot:XP_009535559.1 hypothetical protein PHYSODRAFT_524171 [Phytophthora sojae]